MGYKIAVVIGSTRQGRHTDKLAKWVANGLGDKADVELLDLLDYPMPFLNESVSPRYNPSRKPDPETKKWLDRITMFDGYIFVTPEYNRATSAVLKNAIDVLGHEMDDKPVALVGHGSSGGAQAIANLRMIFPGVGAVTIPQALFFSDRLPESIDNNGKLKQEIAKRPHGPKTALAGQLDSLLWYTKALKTARK